MVKQILHSGFSRLSDRKGALAMEYALLFGVLVLGLLISFDRLLNALVGYYGMMSSLNALPF